jgi:hypothetical protein
MRVVVVVVALYINYVGGETSGKSQRDDDDATFGWLWFGLWLCILFSHEPHKIHPHCFLEIGRETF